MSRSSLIELWTRYLDGDELSEVEREELRQGLEQDPGARQIVLNDWNMDGVLRHRAVDPDAGRRFTAGVTTLIAAQSDDGRFTAKVKDRLGPSARRRAVRRPVWHRYALAAGLLLGVLGVWRALPGRPVVTGDLPVLTEESRTLQIGERLVAAQPAELRWGDGTRAEVAAGTALVVGDPAGGKHLELADGRLHVIAAAQPAGKPMSIRSDQATTTVVGTDFTLDVGKGQTRLDVRHGAVRFGRPQATELLVADSHGAVADAFALRESGQPIFAWFPGMAGAPIPVTGSVDNAPDGRPCLVATDDKAGVVAVSFHRPGGLFAFDPRTTVTARVWIGKNVRWAGFYVQDYEHKHHAQWHLPLDRRDEWRDIRFTLGEMVKANTPLLSEGDVAHYFVFQAQFPPAAEIYLERFTVQPPDDLAR